MSNRIFYVGEEVIVTSNKNFNEFKIGETVEIIKINSHGFICRNDAGDVWALSDAEIKGIN